MVVKWDERVASAGVGDDAAGGASERNYKISGLVKARKTWTSGAILLFEDILCSKWSINRHVICEYISFSIGYGTSLAPISC